MTTAGLSAQTVTAARPELRADFRAELERKLEGRLGLPGTHQRSTVEGLVADMLGEPDEKGLRHFDLSKLDGEKLAELKRLEKASEDFEAVFVKGLLSKMRQTSWAQDEGPMGDLARDFMDQAVAESVARSRSSLGIAKSVFVDMAQRVVGTSRLAKTGESNGKED
jgi:hypothetical protein